MQKAHALDRLHQRAALLNAMRGFFAERGVMEVQPPCLGPAAMAPELASVATDATDEQGRALYLQTSPESAMKQLLAAGSGDIFYLGPAWRGGEHGRWHAIEFTLLEWYRIGYDHYALMHELAELVECCRKAVTHPNQGHILDSLDSLEGHAENGATSRPHRSAAGREYGEQVEGRLSPARRELELLSYQQAFLDLVGVDPLSASREQLLAAVRRAAIGLHEESHGSGHSYLEGDQLLDLLLSHVISPQLGQGRLTFLTGFPASQAALARVDEADPRTAQRFELFMAGLEIANGYHELTDATAQRRRFEQEREARRAAGLAVHDLDEGLLAALESGVPQCAGVAVGVDRLLAVMLGAQSLAEVTGPPTS